MAANKYKKFTFKVMLVNLPPRAKRGAEDLWSTYHLEQSERKKIFRQPTTSSEASS